MIDWYLDVRKLISSIRAKSLDAFLACQEENNKVAEAIAGYLRNDYHQLQVLWEKNLPVERLGALGRHIRFGKSVDYRDILAHDLPAIEEALEQTLRVKGDQQGTCGFEELLDSGIADASYQQYRSGHIRDAVLNSIIAVFDLIRSRTGLQCDGDALVGKAFALENPHLVFSELETESGRNDQKGFMQILKGAFQGVRNPKAHSLLHDLDRQKAAQYLIFASLLARRVREARPGVSHPRTER